MLGSNGFLKVDANEIEAISNYRLTVAELFGEEVKPMDDYASILTNNRKTLDEQDTCAACDRVWYVEHGEKAMDECLYGMMMDCLNVDPHTRYTHPLEAALLFY